MVISYNKRSKTFSVHNKEGIEFGEDYDNLYEVVDALYETEPDEDISFTPEAFERLLYTFRSIEKIRDVSWQSLKGDWDRS